MNKRIAYKGLCPLYARATRVGFTKRCDRIFKLEPNTDPVGDPAVTRKTYSYHVRGHEPKMATNDILNTGNRLAVVCSPGSSLSFSRREEYVWQCVCVCQHSCRVFALILIKLFHFLFVGHRAAEPICCCVFGWASLVAWRQWATAVLSQDGVQVFLVSPFCKNINHHVVVIFFQNFFQSLFPITSILFDLVTLY